MRLTLRTLLAYLDEILEPDDAEVIRKKIDESEFAGELVHRVRDCMRRLRLAAPPVEGKGIAVDANSVAEYLDNTLSSERVPDFEKVCLESDVHLAEVSACHQILTLVLGEPAEVEPGSREKMYQLIAQADAKPAPPVVAPTPDAPAAAVVIAPPVAAPKVEVRPRARPEVPDYLREPRSRFWPIAAVVLLAAMLTAGALAMFGPTQWRQQVASLFGRADNAGVPVPIDDSSNDESAGHSDRENADRANTGRVTADIETERSNAARSNGHTAAGDNESGVKTDDGNNAAEVPRAKGDVTRAKEGDEAADEAAAIAQAENLEQARMASGKGKAGSRTKAPTDDESASSQGEPGRDDIAASAPGRGKSGEVRLPKNSDTGMEDEPDAPTPEKDSDGAAGAGTARTSDNPSGDKEAGDKGGRDRQTARTGQPGANDLANDSTNNGNGGAAVAVPVGGGMGRYLSEPGAMLRYDGAARDWRRLDAMAPLIEGDRLLTLPDFRARFSLSGGVSVDTVGPALVTLSKPDSASRPGIAIDYGRFLLFTLGKPGAELQVITEKVAGVMAFGDTQGTVGIEVRRLLPFGQDPEKAPDMILPELFAKDGDMTWNSDQGSFTLKSGQRRRLTGDVSLLTAADESFPLWVTGDDRPQSALRAEKEVREALAANRPLRVALPELTTVKRQETRSLTYRALSYVDEFDDFVATLNDAQQKNYWDANIETLRDAIARGPQTAGRVRETFEKHRGSRGHELYRMLWMYTNQQLTDGDAAQLVKYLDDDSLDIRVLAFWNIKMITGAQFFYEPQKTTAQRRQSTERFRTMLKDNKMQWSEATTGAARQRPPARAHDRPETKAKTAPAAE